MRLEDSSTSLETLAQGLLGTILIENMTFQVSEM